ncbi:hypothetical protein SAMN06298212_12043, partial [Ruaniaceae bacterium KH17]
SDSETSTTTDSEHSSRPEDSDQPYTLDCDEPENPDNVRVLVQVSRGPSQLPGAHKKWGPGISPGAPRVSRDYCVSGPSVGSFA